LSKDLSFRVKIGNFHTHSRNHRKKSQISRRKIRSFTLPELKLRKIGARISPAKMNKPVTQCVEETQ